MGGLRIALRVEGGDWAVYVAATGTMDNALRFASIRMAAITSEDARKAWVDAMTLIGTALIEDMTGLRVLRMEVGMAPEHEKAGRA